MTLPSEHPRGAAALIALIGVTVFTLMILTSVTTLASNAFAITLDATATERTFYAAEAGLNEGLYRLVHNAAPQTFTLDFDDSAVNITISSNPLNPYQRVVESRAEDSTGKVRTLEVIANTSSFAGGFDHAVQTGAGGVYMDSNSAVIGNIYSNGDVTGRSSAQARGSVVVAGTSTIDQQDITDSGELSFGRQVGNSDAAQSFIPGTSSTLNRVSVRLRKVGDPASLWLRIVSGGASQPNNVAAANVSIDTSQVSTSAYAWLNINLPTPLGVTAGQKYWIVLDDDSTGAGSYWLWKKDSSDSYAGGTALYSNNDWDNVGVAWAAIEADGADLNFITGLGPASTRLENITVWGNAYANRISGTGGSSYARVCGDAYYDTILASSNSYLSNPSDQDCPLPLTPGTGYPGSPDRAPLPLPINDTSIQQWKDEITASGNVLNPNSADCPMTYASGWYCVVASQTLGGQKINGSLYVAGDVTLTLTGNLWATGRVVLDNSGTSGIIKLAPSLGPGSAVVIGDDTTNVDPGASMQGSGDPKSFLLMLSTSTSMDPGNPALYASNNSTSIIFGAHRGMLKVKNNGQLNAAVAQQLFLEPNSTVTYNPNLIYFTVPSGSEEPVGTALGTWREK